MPSTRATVRSALQLALLLGVVLAAAGCSPPSILLTPVFNARDLDEVRVEPGPRHAKIAVIGVEGLIVNATTGGNPLQPGVNKIDLFKQELDKAARDRAVRAVVLRVNSPGGTVTGSDTMYALVRQFKQETGKPVVASVQEVAASGGYYVSLAADEIWSQPTAVVGSVGVIFTRIDVSQTLGLVGARVENIKSGRMKDMGSPLTPVTEDERQITQGMIDAYFARFVETVLRHRDLASADLPNATDGRVFTGEQALELKLIDAVGTLDDAVAAARRLAGLSDASVIIYRRSYEASGSYYARHGVQPSAWQVSLPEAVSPLPAGFYYIWRP
ncbi:MAG: signal peptide peptidase SppA [Phycisphaerae bacterium]